MGTNTGTSYDKGRERRIKSLEKEVKLWRGRALGMAQAAERLLVRIDRASGGSPRTRVEESVHKKVQGIVALDHQRHLDSMKPGLDMMETLLKAGASRIRALDAASKALKRETLPAALYSIRTRVEHGAVFYSVRQVGALIGLGSNGGNLSRHVRGRYVAFFVPGDDFIPDSDPGHKKMIYMRWTSLNRLLYMVARDEPKWAATITKLFGVK